MKPANCTQVINPATNAVGATWPTAPMTSPHGLTIDGATHRVISAGQGELVVMDQVTGKVLSWVAIAPGYADEIAFDPDTRRVYCASSLKTGPSQVSVVQETADGVKLLGYVPVLKGSHTLAVDPQTHHVWVSGTDGQNSYLTEYVPS